jgi:uncharacterized membrane protein YedE/YeeE
MKLGISAFVCGLVFGLGLTISHMIDANKVQNFLDITGDWDPSLLIVLISALSVTFLGYRFILRSSQPVWDNTFHLPTKRVIDKPLLIGASLFGVGWGISGYCPGPALTALGLGVMDPIYFIVGMILGWGIWFIYQRK